MNMMGGLRGGSAVAASSSDSRGPACDSWFSTFFGQCCIHPPETSEGELRENPAPTRHIGSQQQQQHGDNVGFLSDTQVPHGIAGNGISDGRRGPGDQPRRSQQFLSVGGVPQAPVQVSQEERAYLIDNSILKIRGPPGVAYRYSKSKADKVGSDAPTKVAKWGEIVHGIDQGDGWLKVGNYYLPMLHDGKAVITLVTLPSNGQCQQAPPPDGQMQQKKPAGNSVPSSRPAAPQVFPGSEQGPAQSAGVTDSGVPRLPIAQAQPTGGPQRVPFGPGVEVALPGAANANSTEGTWEVPESGVVVAPLTEAALKAAAAVHAEADKRAALAEKMRYSKLSPAPSLGIEAARCLMGKADAKPVPACHVPVSCKQTEREPLRAAEHWSLKPSVGTWLSPSAVLLGKAACSVPAKFGKIEDSCGKCASSEMDLPVKDAPPTADLPVVEATKRSYKAEELEDKTCDPSFRFLPSVGTWMHALPVAAFEGA